ERRRRRRLAAPHAVERAFEFVREGGDLVEAEHRAGALDGVQGAKGGVDEVAVAGIAFEVEQRLFEPFEQVRSFLAEDVCGVGGSAHPINFFTTLRSCSCLNGLVIQAVAPAALASRFRLSSDSVVRKTIGTPR